MRCSIRTRSFSRARRPASSSGATSAELLGEENLVTLDMGGTSTDISVIQDGVIAQTRQGTIAGQQIGTPMTEIQTIGAGGGTIAWIGHRRAAEGVGRRAPAQIQGPPATAAAASRRR